MAKEYTLRFTEEELRAIQAALNNKADERTSAQTGQEETEQASVVQKILDVIGRFL